MCRTYNEHNYKNERKVECARTWKCHTVLRPSPPTSLSLLYFRSGLVGLCLYWICCSFVETLCSDLLSRLRRPNAVVMDTNPSDSFAHTFPGSLPEPVPKGFPGDGSKLFLRHRDADAHVRTHRPDSHSHTHGKRTWEYALSWVDRSEPLTYSQPHPSVQTHTWCLNVGDRWLRVGVWVPGVYLLSTCSMWRDLGQGEQDGGTVE